MPLDRSEIIATLKQMHLFRGVEEAQLETAADLMEMVELAAGTAIYHQNDDPDFFYFIASGRVLLSRYDPHTHLLAPLGSLEEADYFGEEVLESGWPRQVNAETGSEVTLLRLSVPRFVALLEVIPPLAQRLQFILDSYRLRLNSHFTWQAPNETLYFVARRHLLFLWLRILPPTLFGLVLIPLLLTLYLSSPLSTTMLLILVVVGLVTAGWWVWGYVDWSNDYYILTDQRIAYQERVVLLYDSRQEAPIEAVQSTQTHTSQWGRWLGYGNVAIRTYIGTIFFRSVSKPEQVMALIQEHQARAQIHQRRAEVRAIENTIEGKIGLTAPPPPAPKAAKPAPASPTQRFLSDLLHLRYESGGTIQYRTHWFILLKKIWAPSLLLTGLATLVIGRLAGWFTTLSLLATCGVVSFAGFFTLLWWLYQYWDWHNDIYLITPDQVIDVYKKPLGREERQAAPLKNILSIEYERLGIIGLLLNFGTVHIRVGDQTLTFDDVFNPAEVQRELFHRLTAKNFAEKQAAAEGERQRLAEWIAAYHRVAQQRQPPRNPPPTRGGF